MPEVQVTVTEGASITLIVAPPGDEMAETLLGLAEYLRVRGLNNFTLEARSQGERGEREEA